MTMEAKPVLRHGEPPFLFVAPEGITKGDIDKIYCAWQNIELQDNIEFLVRDGLLRTEEDTSGHKAHCADILISQFGVDPKYVGIVMDRMGIFFEKEARYYGES